VGHSLFKIQIFPNNKAIFHFLLLTLPTAQLCRLHKEYGLNAGISGVMGKRYSQRCRLACTLRAAYTYA